jgi:hypothetical protein
MAKLGKSVRGHEELKKKAKKAGLIVSERKFGRVASFRPPSK